jgi:hypothetical protein
MAAFKYDNYREEAGNGTMQWPTLNVKLAFVSILYEPDPAHVFLSEVEGLLATSGSFTNLFITDGYATGLCPEFLLLRNDDPITGALLFDDTGDPATSKLIAYSDDGPAFPFTAIGFDYTVAYNAAEGGWFRI